MKKYRVNGRSYINFNQAAGIALKASLEANDPIDLEVLNGKGQTLYYLEVSVQTDRHGDGD